MTVPLMQPYQTSTLLSGFAVNELSPEESRAASWLAMRLSEQRMNNAMSQSYYDGLQPITNLGIAMPPVLDKLRTILGWCQSGVDAVDERLTVQGFRLPNSVTADDELWEIFQANDLPANSPLVHKGSMIHQIAFAVIGPGPGGLGDVPRITTESALTMAAVWDRHTREMRAALSQTYDFDPTSETYGYWTATLYVKGSTVQLVQGNKGWSVTQRDDHNMPVPVVPFANNPTIDYPWGRSEITDAWRNTVDRACRTTNAMEAAREYYAIPHFYGLGMTEQAFVDLEGNPVPAWKAAANMFNMFEADESGNLPQIGALPTGDPGNFIKLLDQDVRTMAGLTGLPAHYLGIFNDGNPASADAIRMSDFRLKSKADRKSVAFGDAWERTMRMALLVRDGSVNPDLRRLETDWAPTGIPTPAADTDSVTKQIAAGMVPPTSDVALASVGYSAVERARIEDERRAFEGDAKLQALIAAAGGGKAAPPPQQQAQPVTGNGQQPAG